VLLQRGDEVGIGDMDGTKGILRRGIRIVEVLQIEGAINGARIRKQSLQILFRADDGTLEGGGYTGAPGVVENKIATRHRHGRNA
jgi:hypothetical protein